MSRLKRIVSYFDWWDIVYPTSQNSNSFLAGCTLQRKMLLLYKIKDQSPYVFSRKSDGALPSCSVQIRGTCIYALPLLHNLNLLRLCNFGNDSQVGKCFASGKGWEKCSFSVRKVKSLSSASIPGMYIVKNQHGTK